MAPRREPDLTPVLLYHDVVDGRPTSTWQVSRSALAADLDAVVRSGRTVVTASALDAELNKPNRRSTHLCALTFDDGYASFLEQVLPLLVERRLPATLYVTTGLLGEPRMLSQAALTEIIGNGIEIAAHAVRHRHLDLLSDTELHSELRGSRERLGELVGNEPTSFAYPYGSYNRPVQELVCAAGYTNAYAVKNALTHAGDDQYAHARLTVRADTWRGTVKDWLAGRGAPSSWPGERLRTKAFRRIRAVQEYLG
jgi:peptidoglycan/xylan/chitin deacetylase (PgdA/CDA1 family)